MTSNTDPGWRLVYIHGGRDWHATTKARNQTAADEKARIALATQFHDFDPVAARLVQCFQTS